MKSFDYIRPASMEEALAALKENDNPYLLGGGTDLLNGMKNMAVQPQCVIDLKGIPGIDAIEYKDGFQIGALTTVREIEISPLVRQKIPVLSEAAASLGSIQIRNRATVGGNLCHGSPAADMAAVLLAMNCEVDIVSARGGRTLPLTQFFTGYRCTALDQNEILAGIRIAPEIERFKGTYLKLGPRKAMDIGLVNIAVLLDSDGDSGVCNRIMIALGAVAPIPLRAEKAEAMLNGKELKPGLIREAAEAAANEAEPITDFRASAEYRKDMVKNLILKGIAQTLEANTAV